MLIIFFFYLRYTKVKNVFQKCFAGSTDNATIIHLATLVTNIISLNLKKGLFKRKKRIMNSD